MRLFPPFLIKYISRNPEKTGELALVKFSKTP
ncbi:hypothetical protein T4B_9299 [Trichinella pseudospiralis]|uniref:Uncharacterized protein n=1 Tax=Trichinella pseudospiralis TaxID=6337 RepID=A0A0V1GM25_TRIPS|nr:hypothetical protein T4B_9299 [Trichinella pseudospiralis]